MRLLSSFIVFILLSGGLSAQQLPNVSFESWGSTLAPDGWGTWGSAVSSFAPYSRLVQRDTFDFTNGHSSMRLTVDTMTIPAIGLTRLSGFASLGGAYYVPPPTGVGLTFGYYRYAQRPDSLFFDYKYIPAAGFTDTGLIAVTLTRFDTTTRTTQTMLSFAQTIAPSPQWTTQVIPLSPLYNNIYLGLPDSLQIIIYASYTAAHAGSYLWVDSLHFDQSVVPVTGISILADGSVVSLYPDPASQSFTIHLDQPHSQQLIVYDIYGREVYQVALQSADTQVDCSVWPAGIYSYGLRGPDHLLTHSGKLIVTH